MTYQKVARRGYFPAKAARGMWSRGATNNRQAHPINEFRYFPNSPLRFSEDVTYENP